ncbi:MAG: hypothetical protein ACLFV8_05945, partial [Alphaproteobacteria bacterium]
MTLLHSYRDRIDRAIRARTGDPIFNGTSEHASIIMERMFYHASKSIDILAGRFNVRIYGQE